MTHRIRSSIIVCSVHPWSTSMPNVGTVNRSFSLILSSRLTGLTAVLVVNPTAPPLASAPTIPMKKPLANS